MPQRLPFFGLLLLAICFFEGALRAAAPAYRDAVLADNPIAYWQLDEAAGATTAVDSAGTPQSGTCFNVTLGQPSAFANLGTCGSFNGTNSRVVTPFDAAFNLGSGDFSIECWYRTSVSSRGDIFNFKAGGGDLGIFANNGSSGNIGGWFNTGALPSATAALSAWHHIVYVRSGGTITLYVDGQARASAANAQSVNSPNASVIFGANQTSFWFNGLIDEVAYYNSALSAERVALHYSYAQVTPTAPAVANGPATNIYATSATLGANVTDNGNNAPQVTVFYGPTDGGTSPAAWAGSVSLGVQSGAATGTATGLSPNASYFYRARAVNSIGTAWAASSATFTTPTPSLPSVTTLSATNISGIAANLRGQVTDAGNHPPAITIYYGTADGGTNAGAWASSVVVPGGQTGAFFQQVENLTPLTTYYYRCFAQNLAGSAWAPASQSFETPAFVPPTVVINELHINEDDATIHSEFIELYNASNTTQNLGGWFFDKGIDFTFPPGVTLAPGTYLIVCEDPATIQTRYSISGATVISWQTTNPPRWNTLSNNGENIALRDAGGNLIDEVDYQLGFPWPTVGDLPSRSMELIHPSLDNSAGGSWRGSTSGPTPRAQNSVFAANAPPAIRQVVHAPASPVANQVWMRSQQAARISARVTDPDEVQSVSLQYQIVEPGDYIKIDDARYNAAASWTTIAMQDDGQGGDAVAGDSIYTGTVPSAVQIHRRLIRYRITVTDTLGASVRVPYADDPQPNFAYFVYDDLPAWTGSQQPGTFAPVTYTPQLLATVPQYHLITRVEEHANAQNVPVIKADGTTQPNGGDYTHDEDLWKGALCHDGVVYDHIRFRARGGVWRFRMGKNMWKFDFNRGHDLVARSNYGVPYNQTWKKLNFSSVIQQGDFNHRGEQGLFESVGFRLFQLTGIPAEHTHFAHFRIIERPSETNNSSNQFDDDFQGLYLAIEQQDGQFLDEHGLPDGNLYKMENGTGELNNQGPSLPKDKSDLNAFINPYGTDESWWRANCDLPNYYNYRAIVDCIHHYDIGDGKNYFYFHNPDTNKWTALPWDLDLTWADNMYRGDSGIAGLTPVNAPQNSTEPFFSRVFGNGSTTGITALQREHRNRMREILDLLFTPEQTGMLIDEMASFIYQPGQPSFVDADRAMWDYNPILTSPATHPNKAGHGRFYQSAVDNPATPGSEVGTFAGMIQKMKNYVVTRRSVITTNVLTSTEENLVPNTPTITRAGGGSGPIPTNALTFSTSAFVGKNGATFSAMKWRIAAVTEPGVAGFQPYGRGTPRLYEADPANTFESPEITTFNATYTFPPIAARVGQTHRARVKFRDNTGRWSHWSPPLSFTAGEPNVNVYLQGLVVSQIMYNPLPPTPAEQPIAQDDDSFEWIELKNVGATPLDLTPIGFTKGIDFDFAGSAVTTLAPGARVVVVNNLAAFNARYAGQLAGVQVAGEWNGNDNLSNNTEQVTLTYGVNTPIRDFTYDDEAPWPVAGDQGHALVLLAPETLPNHGQGWNWRSSVAPHGKPGLGDSTTFATWAAANSVSDPAADEDKDALNNLAEYALRGSPASDSTALLPQASLQTLAGQKYLIFTFRRQLAADDLTFTPEISTNLTTWQSGVAHLIPMGETNHADGSATLTYRGINPFSPATPQFVRLKMAPRE